MVQFIFPLLYFLTATAFFVLLFKKKFGKILPLTLMITTFTYFFSQVFFKTFLVGFLFNILFVVLFFFGIFYLVKTKKDTCEFRSNFFTKGFYAFIIIYTLIFLFDYNRLFTMWDEYSHWGEMVKEMFRLDRFYSVSSSTLMAHKDYPPMVSLFELFYCHLSGGYSELSLIKSIHLLCLSFLIPSIFESNENYDKKKFFIKVLFMSLGSFLIFLLFDGHHILNTIYIDYFLVVLVSYLLFVIFSSDDLTRPFTILILMTGFSFLLLTKQMGLPFYLMCLFLYCFELVSKEKGRIKGIFTKEKVVKIVGIISLLILFPLFLWKSWNSYTNSLKIDKQFELSDIPITELKDILINGKGEEYQQEIVSRYFEAIKKQSISTSYVPITYGSGILLVILLLLLECYLFRNKIKKRKFIELMITLFIGSIGYFLVMLILYVFSFGEVEGLALASFNRYMPTYLLIGLSISYMIFIYYDSRYSKNSFKSYLILIIILILLQTPSNLKSLIPKVRKTPMNDYQYHASMIEKKTEPFAKVFLLVQNSEGDYQYAVKYYMNPRITNLTNFSFPVENITNYQEYFHHYIKNELVKYDYLYIVRMDDVVKEKYDFLLKDYNLVENKVYKIVYKKGNLELIEKD